LVTPYTDLTIDFIKYIKREIVPSEEEIPTFGAGVVDPATGKVSYPGTSEKAQRGGEARRHWADDPGGDVKPSGMSGRMRENKKYASKIKIIIS
jgi:hypothetical protein